MENLFSPDVLQPRIQILDLLHNIINLALVRALNLARLANNHIQLKLDSSMHSTSPKPTSARGYILRCEAEPVLARVGGRECEAALARSTLGYDSVVVVKGLFDGDKDADVGFGLVGLGLVVPDLGVVVA